MSVQTGNRILHIDSLFKESSTGSKLSTETETRKESNGKNGDETHISSSYYNLPKWRNHRVKIRIKRQWLSGRWKVIDQIQAISLEQACEWEYPKLKLIDKFYFVNYCYHAENVSTRWSPATGMIPNQTSSRTAVYHLDGVFLFVLGEGCWCFGYVSNQQTLGRSCKCNVKGGKCLV